MKRFAASVILVSLVLLNAGAATVKAVDPPAPLAPVPSKADVEILKLGMVSLLHFGLYTFNNGTSDGTQDPDKFRPMQLNCDQWVAALKGGGINLPILVVKHGIDNGRAA